MSSNEKEEWTNGVIKAKPFNPFIKPREFVMSQAQVQQLKEAHRKIVARLEQKLDIMKSEGITENEFNESYAESPIGKWEKIKEISRKAANQPCGATFPQGTDQEDRFFDPK